MATTTSTVGTREVFVDQRGPSRSLRVSWHPEHGVAVLSLWSDDGPVSRCVSTFRLPVDQVPAFVHHLTSGLASMAATPPPGADACARLVQDGTVTPTVGERLRSGIVGALDGAAETCARWRDRLGRA